MGLYQALYIDDIFTFVLSQGASRPESLFAIVTGKRDTFQMLDLNVISNVDIVSFLSTQFAYVGFL